MVMHQKITRLTLHPIDKYSVVFLTTFLVFFAFSSCIFTDTGTNSFIKESINKAQTKKAILFLKEAGATVADSYQVIVAKNNHKFDKSEVGNAFTVDANHGYASL
jgi:hypothetical protein